jgi:hypothetical protein
MISAKPLSLRRRLPAQMDMRFQAHRLMLPDSHAFAIRYQKCSPDFPPYRASNFLLYFLMAFSALAPRSSFPTARFSSLFWESP